MGKGVLGGQETLWKREKMKVSLYRGKIYLLFMNIECRRAVNVSKLNISPEYIFSSDISTKTPPILMLV